MVFEKLHKFIGKAIKQLVSDEVDYCLRLQKGRVYYVREDLMRRATNVARDKLVGLGVCIGKFTHGGKFRLTIGGLDVLSKYAKYKVRSRITFIPWGTVIPRCVVADSDDVKTLQSSDRSLRLVRRTRINIQHLD